MAVPLAWHHLRCHAGPNDAAREREGQRRECRFDHSALAPDFLTTADHLVSSRSMVAAYSSGVVGRGSVPSLAMRSMVSGAASASRSAVLSLAMIGAGVPAGATIPYCSTTSKPGRAASATVGTSGKAGERLALVTASARTLPSRTSPIADGSDDMYMATWPPSRSVSAGPVPR